jgi:HTH-type transcriptional regulator, sugar sensing transcriptional regulator
MNAMTLDRLIRLGLTQYEGRAYLALVRRDGSTPGEVATLAGVPRPRIYDVLHSLVAKGLAVERPGHTAKYLAVPPVAAMERLVAAHRQQMESLEADARSVTDELTPAFQEGQGHDSPLDYIEVIRDRETLARRFVELEGLVTGEMLAFSKTPVALRIDRNTAGIELAATHTLRSVYEFSVLDDPLVRDGIWRFVTAGEEARFVPELPMKLALMDERTVMFALPDPVAGTDDLTSVIIDHPALAKLLKIAFEAVWQTGVNLEEAHRHLGIPYPEAS